MVIAYGKFFPNESSGLAFFIYLKEHRDFSLLAHLIPLTLLNITIMQPIIPSLLRCLLIPALFMLVQGCTSSASRLGMTGGGEADGSSGEVATNEERPATSNNEIAALLSEHPFDILIVGCGKYPERWQSSTGVVTADSLLENKGDHTHAGCITLAEDPNIVPLIVHDWTQPIPEALHGRFRTVYLEKLPYNVLDQEQCMQNLFDALQSGGVGCIDVQTNFREDGKDGCVTGQGIFELPSEQSLLDGGQFTTGENGELTITKEYQEKVESNMQEFIQKFGLSVTCIGHIPVNPFNQREMDKVIIVQKPVASTPEP